MLKKILMDRDYVPERKFDWSLRPGEHFGRVDQNDKHSSISSCCISSYEEVYDPGECQQLQANIDKCLFEYIKPKRLNYSMLQGAKPGQSQIFYKIPENFMKVGEFQYLPNDALGPIHQNQYLFLKIDEL